MNPFLALLLAAATSALVIPPLRRLAPHLGLMDQPDPRKVHAMPVPRVGGWGITAGVLIALPLLLEMSGTLLALLAGCLVLFVAGVWDDVRQISHWPKFLGQILAAGLVVYAGDLHVSRVPFIGFELDPVLGKPLTMVAIIGVINAVNHSDGLDGLAAGESMLSLIAIAVLAGLVHDPVVMGVALVAMGALLGFLRYNSHPAQVFMGDAGSQVLGLVLAFLVVYLTQSAHTAVSAALPLLLLGLPIADILAVLFLRIRGRGHWFKATRNHVHHRLLDLGFSHFATVVIIYTVQALTVLGAVLLRYEADILVTMTYLLIVTLVFGGLVVGERRGWNASRGPVMKAIVRATHGLQQLPNLQFWPALLVSAGTLVVVLASSIIAVRVPHDIGVAALVLAAAMTGELLWRRSPASLVSRAISYAAVMFASYLLVYFPAWESQGSGAVVAIFIAGLAVAIAVHLRVAADSSFSSTPTDFLVALIALGALVLAASGAAVSSTPQAAKFLLYATVLMYAYEAASRLRQQRALQLCVLATLAVMSMRGLLAY
jgi:UDP-GlcNAc:undecaprenyl-phosphate/decaprenyl-phosphate GlcNAc-1-phosphate transferase